MDRLKVFAATIFVSVVYVCATFGATSTYDRFVGNHAKFGNVSSVTGRFVDLNASGVTQDSTHRFVTDTEKASWTFSNYSTLRTIGRGGNSGIAVNDLVTKGPYVDVRAFGAKGDGENVSFTDDTVAAQAAVDATPSGGVLVFTNVPGRTNTVYMIKATGAASNGSGGGIILTKPIKIVLYPGVTLKAITGNKDQSVIIQVSGTSNVSISGGNLVGDRLTNTNTGEWGHGIYVLNSSNVTIKDMTISDVKGDGIRVVSTGTPMSGFFVENVTIDSYRRWGIAYAGGHDVILRNVTTKNHVQDLRPLTFGGGIDFEDEYDLNDFNNILVDNCQFINNDRNGGITINGATTKFRVLNSLFDGNTYGINIAGVNVTDVVTSKNRYINTSITCVRISGDSSSGSPKATGVTVEKSYFDLNNAAQAVVIGGATHDVISDVRIINHNIFANGKTTAITAVIMVDPTMTSVAGVTVDGNTFTGGYPLNLNGATDVAVGKNNITTSVSPALSTGTVPGIKVINNSINALGIDGISVAAPGSLVSGNDVKGGFSGKGIAYTSAATGSLILGNTIDASNGSFGISASGSSSNFIDNVVTALKAGSTAFSITPNHYTWNNMTAGIPNYPRASRGVWSGAPTSGTYEVGEWTIDTSGVGWFGRSCVIKGSMETVNTTCTADGSADVVVASATSIYVGMYVKVGGVTKQVLAINGTTITLSTTIGAGSGITFINSAATFRPFGWLDTGLSPNIASNTTISPVGTRFHVTGTNAISTINLPFTGFVGSITMIPDAVFTTVTGGNIAKGSTAVVGVPLTMTYDGTLWYPSY